MGANAQTTVPTFVTSQVLTADQMNQSARTGVPVFADSTARDAAFGGTGEKTLAEGQLAYIENLDVVQYYDGSSWGTLAPLPGGLAYLTGATFTTVTSFSLPNDTFSATYRNYRMVINITAVTADATFTMRLRGSGSDITSANYIDALQGIDFGGNAANLANVSATSWNMGEQDATAVRYDVVLDIQNPKATAVTNVKSWYTYVNTAGTAVIVRQGVQQYDLTTSADSLSFISSVASSITGSYRVYGYADS